MAPKQRSQPDRAWRSHHVDSPIILTAATIADGNSAAITRRRSIGGDGCTVFTGHGLQLRHFIGDDILGSWGEDPFAVRRGRADRTVIDVRSFGT